MKISQPKTARVINTARVLSQIRSNSGLSKAEIARILDLNKVSTGEIVDNLIESGLVRETGKIEVVNGRKPTCLELESNARYVLAVDIGRKNVTTALCDLVGKPIKIERLPIVTDKTQEDFCISILKSSMRTIKLVEPEKLLGAGITIEGEIASDNKTVTSSFLPWKDVEIGQVFEKALNVKTIVSNSLCSYVSAEKQVNPGLRLEERLLYVDWGHCIALAIVRNGQVVNATTTFGRGLEEKCSSISITQNMDLRLGDVWDKINDGVFETMGRALETAYDITGINSVIMGGEAATITDSALSKLQQFCPRMIVRKSSLGDRAEIQAAAESALDYFFFLTTALDGMKEYI